MIGRSRLQDRRTDDEHTFPTQYYECSYCQRSVDEWIEDCPHCGQLVVRIVEPPGRTES